MTAYFDQSDVNHADIQVTQKGEWGKNPLKREPTMLFVYASNLETTLFCVN